MGEHPSAIRQNELKECHASVHIIACTRLHIPQNGILNGIRNCDHVQSISHFQSPFANVKGSN
eukprot:c11796_g1_i1 orf=2-187(-)